MEEQIFNANEIPWVKTDQGKTKVLVGEKYSDTGRFRLFRLDPDQTFNSHEHEFTQCMYFTSGTGKVTVDDREEEITKGLTVIVLPKQCHSITNTGKDPIEIIVFESHDLSSQDTPFVDF